MQSDDELELWLEADFGASRAEAIVNAWSRNQTEKAFLDALSVGHGQAEARRLSGLTRGQSDALIRRIKGE